MSNTRQITRNASGDPAGDGDADRAPTSTLGPDLSRWGAVLHGQVERATRSGRDAQAEIALRRNRSGQ
jgi:hypothetical protein